MSATVVKLHQPKPSNKQQTLDVIEKIKTMVEQDQIQQLVGVFIDANGMFGTVSCRDPYDYRMVGAMEIAKLEMMDMCLSGVTNDAE